jgi:hydroxyacid-oxoacid transhydrogenase
MAIRRIRMMRRIAMPDGLGALGYTVADVDMLVACTLPQHRVTKLAPRSAGPDDPRQMFLDALALW